MSSAPPPELALPADETKESANPADQLRVLLAALAAASIGALMYNILPLYLGSMEAGKGLASSQTGLIGTAFFLGFNVAGMSAFLWIRRLPWRAVSLLSMPVLFAMLLGSAHARTFPKLLMVTAACGVAFGINYTIGSVMVGDTSRPERWYGVKVGVETLAGAAILFVLPLTSAARYGFTGTLCAVAITIALLLPFLFFLPNRSRSRPPVGAHAAAIKGDGAEAPRVNLIATACAIIALLTLFAGVSAIWAFSERIGKLSGFDDASIGGLLAATIITGIAGSIAVAALGERIRPATGFIGALAIILLALAGLTIKGDFALYTVANCLYMFGWAAGTPLAMAEIAILDHDGRYVSFIAPAIGIGGMAGPGIAGWLLEVGNPTTVLIYVASAMLVSGALMAMSSRLASNGPKNIKT